MSTAAPVNAQDPGTEAPDAVLDVVGALERMMGDHRLFTHILKHFRDEYRHTGAAIRKALAAGDLQLAQQVAHTVKGAAGLIGAHALQRAALALEQSPPCGAADGVEHLDIELGRVMLELDNLLGPETAT